MVGMGKQPALILDIWPVLTVDSVIGTHVCRHVLPQYSVL